MIVIGFHLNHGFQSAFQSIGLKHKRYTPIVEKIGAAYSIIVPALFVMVPVVIYFQSFK
jgi:succinate dehydrogenase / fumarate reductase cytochrome b subunit